MNARTQSFDLRPSNETDHDAIADVWHGSASLEGVGPPVMPSRDELRARVDLELAAGWLVTVAVGAGEVIGFVAIKQRDAVLSELFVRPGFLGYGIGQALLAQAMTDMPDGFTLYTRATNSRARRFYEKAGLVYLRDDTHPRTGDPTTHYGWKAR